MTDADRSDGGGRTMRLGFLLHVDEDVAPAQAYRDAIKLFTVAESLGYDSGWVTQRHFHQGNGHVSAPLVLLAAVAQHTDRIRLGTAVVALPLEDPLRVAEDAATVDELSGGRIELGVGSGPFPAAWEAFDRDLARKGELYDTAVHRLHRALEGVSVNGLGEALHPPGGNLRQRVWQATTSNPVLAETAAAAAGRAGDGLQLSRTGSWPNRQSPPQQARIIAVYQAAARAAGHRPRVLLSRSVYPHPDPDAAVREVTPGIRRWTAWAPELSGMGSVGVAEYLRRDHTLLGSPNHIAAQLQSDPVLSESSDLLVSFVPGVPDFDEHVRLLTTTANDVAPQLGWSPAQAAGVRPE
jgi:alkanesulfonate monooxygenase SsuD/methylene tetrahydromethanopterin reductase-like flavin-dependent oxidoreductase (luciferase family)